MGIQADTLAGHQGSVFESVTKTCCNLVEASWDVDRAAIESFLLSLAAYVRERLEQVSAFIYLVGLFRRFEPIGMLRVWNPELENCCMMELMCFVHIIKVQLIRFLTITLVLWICILSRRKSSSRKQYSHS